MLHGPTLLEHPPNTPLELWKESLAKRAGRLILWEPRFHYDLIDTVSHGGL
jgi:hypothetical protein